MPFVVLVTLPRLGPHCCNCVFLLPVDAMVTLLTPGGGRGPDGCELPFGEAEGSKIGYWWKSPPPLFRWCGKGSLRTGNWSPLGKYSTGIGVLLSADMLS